MDVNHQSETRGNLTAIDDTKWVFNKKSNLWVAHRKKPTGFEEKTLWDKLNLFGTLAIPLMVALATIGFSLLQLHLADVQHQQDQQRTLDQQQANTLQTYIDNIQDLLLNHNLLESKPTEEIAILARARTLTALQELDPERKGRLLTFLYEAELIGFEDKTGKLHDPIVDLHNAPLNGANLDGVHLDRANLDGANLVGAHLSDVHLSNASLFDADLRGAILFDADLRGAILIGAHFNSADLSNAWLWHADLTGVDLSNANLSNGNLIGAELNLANFVGADLHGASLNEADLGNAYNLTQQQLDQVYSCKNAILDAVLPQGLVCHRTPKEIVPG